MPRTIHFLFSLKSVARSREAAALIYQVLRLIASGEERAQS